MFTVTKSYKKRNSIIVMLMLFTYVQIAFCIHFSITACCLYLTCSSVSNYSHILCILVTQWFVPVCIKHYSCI
jgi:hypothetical protein